MTLAQTIKYSGKRSNDGVGGQIVVRNGRRLSPRASQKLHNHSPDGFNWGYGGSGPAQLALALLYNATHDNDLSLRYYQRFKWEHVSQWGNSWEITDRMILDWLGRQAAVEGW